MSDSIIITGASGGIGSAITRRCRQDGFFTIGVDRDSSSGADVHYSFDLGRTDALRALAESIAVEHRIAAVVHNAANQPVAGPGETSAEEWAYTLAVNLTAVDAIVGGVKDELVASGGAVVVIGSVHGVVTTGGLTAYAASKAGLAGWVRSAALDLGPEVRVNGVIPGAIDTPKLQEGFARWGDDVREHRMAVLRERTALGRIGTADEVAGAVSFLLGPDAGFVTGTMITVDGGASARLGSE